MTGVPPAIFIAPGNQYGRPPRPGRPEASPVMPAQQTPLMAAAWTCHLIVKETRSAYQANGFHSDRDFYTAYRLSEKAWKKFFRGASWVTVEQVADLVAIFGQGFAAAAGDAYTQMGMAGTLRQDGSARTNRSNSRPLVLTTRKRRATHGKMAPGTSVSDAFWESLNILSERHGVKPPTELHITESTEPWVAGTPDSSVIAGVPDLHAIDWIINDGHLQLDHTGSTRLDLLPSDDEDGELAFQSIPAEKA